MIDVRRPHVPRFAFRSADVGRRLDLFLVCAVGSVIGNRVFLIITGYPQLGNGTLHISHAIWGALMMAVAIIFAIAFLAPNNRTFIAFIGGCGFGWFIDELGKFITRDVNYFFQPTIALIYIVFIAMYLVFRGIQRRDLGPDEALLNALEALKSAAIGELSEPRRAASLALLDRTGADDPLARQVRTLLADEDCLPDAEPEPVRAVGSRRPGVVPRPHAAPVVRVSSSRGGSSVYAVAAVAAAVLLSLDHNAIKGFEEWAVTLSSIVAGLLMLVGLVRIRHSRVAAYRWFERGILVQIFVTQVFEFAQQQLAGVLGLAFNLLLWVAIRSMIRAEVEQELVEREPVAS